MAICASLIFRHPSSPYCGGWPQTYSFFFEVGHISICFGRLVPKPVMLGILGLVKVAVVSVMISGLQLSLYVSPRYFYCSFIVMDSLSFALGPRSNI